MKIIITRRLDESYRMALRNGSGREVELDDLAHRNIRQESEIKARAEALRAPLCADIVWDC